jgi:hypothetical protein
MGICWRLFFCGMGTALAAEPLVLPLDLGTLKTRDGRVFDAAKVVEQDAVGIKILHEAGTARIAYDRLPPGVAARFIHDRAGARAQLEKEAMERAANERAMQQAAAAADDEDGTEVAGAVIEGMPDLAGKAAVERILLLENYITCLRAGIVKIEQDIKKRKEAEDRAAERASDEVPGMPGPAGAGSARHLAKVRRVEAIRSGIEKQERKIAQAKILIKGAEREIRELRDSH